MNTSIACITSHSHFSINREVTGQVPAVSPPGIASAGFPVRARRGVIGPSGSKAEMRLHRSEPSVMPQIAVASAKFTQLEKGETMAQVMALETKSH